MPTLSLALYARRRRGHGCEQAATRPVQCRNTHLPVAYESHLECYQIVANQALDAHMLLVEVDPAFFDFQVSILSYYLFILAFDLYCPGLSSTAFHSLSKIPCKALSCQAWYTVVCDAASCSSTMHRP